MPWNPTRLEQRIGRIKRFGQRRETVDMLNLVFEQTVDEKIYERLSERMKNRYDLFGSLPDTIKDEWIEDVETLGERLDEYINAHVTGAQDPRITGAQRWRRLVDCWSQQERGRSGPLEVWLVGAGQNGGSSAQSSTESGSPGLSRSFRSKSKSANS